MNSNIPTSNRGGAIIIYQEKIKKKVLKAIRTTEDINKVITIDSAQRGISINTLFNLILEKYAEFDRYAEKFGVIILPRYTFKGLLSLIDDQSLVDFARQAGPKEIREIIQFWTGRVELDGFMKFLTKIARHLFLHQYSIQRSGSRYTIILHHDLGMKWSRFLRNFYESALRSLFSIAPQCDETENNVVLSFTPPPNAGYLDNEL